MVSRMLRDSSGYFSEDIHEIRYHYGAWQERFASMRQEDPRYVFVPEVPTMADLPDGSKHTVIVIDDLMRRSANQQQQQTFLQSIVTTET